MPNRGRRVWTSFPLGRQRKFSVLGRAAESRATHVSHTAVVLVIMVEDGILETNCSIDGGASTLISALVLQIPVFLTDKDFAKVALRWTPGLRSEDHIPSKFSNPTRAESVRLPD